MTYLGLELVMRLAIGLEASLSKVLSSEICVYNSCAAANI